MLVRGMLGQARDFESGQTLLRRCMESNKMGYSRLLSGSRQEDRLADVALDVHGGSVLHVVSVLVCAPFHSKPVEIGWPGLTVLSCDLATPPFSFAARSRFCAALAPCFKESVSNLVR